ncbi:ARM repeat-containing protein [Meredithblackwellia eburnea MCA 4105]
MALSDQVGALVVTLQNALSPVEHVRSSSLKQLQEWSLLPTFYHSLIIVVQYRQELQREIRLQAALQFKNGVDKYWRRGAPNGIPMDEKLEIRPKLLAMVDEPDRAIAKTLALSIAKIARLDYGFNWDDLPHSLLQSLQTGLSHPTAQYGKLVLHRSLLFLHATIKSLSSNRIMKGRLLIKTVGGQLFPALKEVYERILRDAAEKLESQGLNGVGGAQGNAEEVEDLELAVLAFKCLAKLVVFAYADASADEVAKAFFTSTPATLATLLNFRLRLLTHALSQGQLPATSENRLSFLTKLIKSHIKLYRTLLSHDASVFAKMGDAPQQVLKVVWDSLLQAGSQTGTISDDRTSLHPEPLVVASLLLLKSCMGDWASESPLSIPSDFAPQFLDVIVTKFLPLRNSDLEKWREDPEEWMNEEEADRWEFELRPCAEHVLQSLLNHYHEILGPRLVSLLQTANASTDPGAGLLLKEGVYCAFGRSSSDLRNTIDFDAWLESTLAPEATGTADNDRIIRRRIAWLLGKWAEQDLAPETSTKVYSLLIHLMSPNASTDTAIRLTAARSLAKCGDTWDFDRNVFLPFLPSAVEQVVALLGEVSLPDSQMRLNTTLGIIIDRMQTDIIPYAPRLSEVLATLWSAATENHFQTSVLGTLTKLTEALGEQSVGLEAQAWPIIQRSVDPSLDSHVYLQEDGLELWQAFVKRASTLSGEMVSLLPLLVSLLAKGTDVLPRVLKILESYLLLDSLRVLQMFGNEIFQAFEILLDDLSLEALKQILRTMEMVFQSAPIDAWAMSLESSNTMLRLVGAVLKNDNPQIATKYLCTLARILLAGPSTFEQLIQATAVKLGSASPAHIFDALVNLWIERVDNMAQASQRKLTALALAQLLPSTQCDILSRLQDLTSVWSGVLAETEENADGDAELYQNAEDYVADEYDFGDTAESTRRTELTKRDPVRSVRMDAVLKEQLSRVQALHGGPDVFQATYLSKVDPALLDELLRRLNGQLAG